MNKKRIFSAIVAFLFAITLTFSTEVNSASADTVPIGTITAYAGDTNGNATGLLAAQGWLICNGEEYPIDDYPELNRIIGTYYGTADRAGYFKLPDLRGRFLRGVDAGAGRDPDAKDRTYSAKGGNTGDRVGSAQADAFKKHSHKIQFNSGRQSNGNSGGRRGKYQESYDLSTSRVGGSETRPKNIYVNWIIKASDLI